MNIEIWRYDMKRVLLAIVLLGLSNVSFGAPLYMSGNELLARANDCEKYRAGEKAPEISWNCGSARSYTMGISDLYFVLNSRWLIERHFCKPDDVSRDQLAVTVKKYMEDHPEKMDLPAAGIIFDALTEAYPCE
jgi:hypothetical protein